MLKPPKVGGAAQLRLFVDELGADRSCKILQIHPTTMRGWLRDARPVPQAPLQALYWLTSYGFGDACSEAHWSHQFAMYKIRELEERLAAMRSGQYDDGSNNREPVHENHSLDLFHRLGVDGVYQHHQST